MMSDEVRKVPLEPNVYDCNYVVHGRTPLDSRMEKRIKIAIYISVVLCCLTILVTAIVVSLLKGKASHPIADTQCGAVEGRLRRVTNDNGTRQKVYEFLNIPYAVPPTGPLRWRAPVSLKSRSACWNGTLPYNDEIIQCVETRPPETTVRGKEDCLILSVRTTSPTKNAKLPVLVWIHGGAMMYGNSREKGYYPDTQFTASMGVVTVSINYRLGIFGFLSLQELWNEKDGYGNYAIMDQILALRWIKDNIENFGGNPNDVTIFGESGGGTATYCLLSASLGMAKGLFHKLIASSGAPNIHTTHIEANQMYRPFINKTNCLKNSTSDIQACLRGLDVKIVNSYIAIMNYTELFLEYEWQFPYNIHTVGIPLEILDPLVVKYSPSDLPKQISDSSHKHRIDILMGNMAQEPPTYERPRLSNWSNWTVLENYLTPRIKSFNNNCSVTELLDLYKKRSRDKFTPAKITPYYIYSLITADILLSCATTELAYNLTHYSPFKVYSYIVSQALRPTEKYVFHAEHAFDVIPLFDFRMLGSGYKPTKEDKELKKNLRLKFKDFIYSSKNFEKKHRNRTIEFWNSTTVHTWETPYHDRECKFLRKNGFLKHSWGNRGIWNS